MYYLDEENDYDSFGEEGDEEEDSEDEDSEEDDIKSVSAYNIYFSY